MHTTLSFEWCICICYTVSLEKKRWNWNNTTKEKKREAMELRKKMKPVYQPFLFQSTYRKRAPFIVLIGVHLFMTRKKSIYFCAASNNKPYPIFIWYASTLWHFQCIRFSLVIPIGFSFSFGIVRARVIYVCVMPAYTFKFLGISLLK